jgi:hypothetical protein
MRHDPPRRGPRNRSHERRIDVETVGAFAMKARHQPCGQERRPDPIADDV